MAYFPMFVNLENKKCLIVGGGKVAFRKVQVLQDFGAEITVIAPNIMDQIKMNAQITYIERQFEQEDLKEMELVIAATDEKEENHRISQLAMQQKIPVNAVDQVEDCSFIFPSYVRREDLVAAISSSGKSPVMTQYLKAQVTEILTEELGALTECLGSIRDEVKQAVGTEAMRKKVYQEILTIGLEQETLPTREQMEQVMEGYRDSK